MEIGVFGGSFDPPHVGHLAVAQDALEVLPLDRILFVPARVSPFKLDHEVTPGDLRARMLEAALARHPAFAMSRVELDRPGPSFTVDTLEHLGRELPSARLTLLMGADQWRAFQGWRDPEGILRRSRVAVLARAGEEATGADHGLAHTAVRVRRMDVSSTEVRDRVRTGRSVRYLVPEAVRQIILENRLYRDPDEPPGAAQPPLNR